MGNILQAGSVTTDEQGGIATISFHHPAHNALPGELLKQLTAAFEEAGNNRRVKAIVLKSGGDRTFCAGASFDELVAIEDFSAGKQFFMGFAQVINAMRKCPQFVIGRVQGKAVGGGVGLAAATDYCIATKYGSIKLSELTIGIGPFVVGPAVERKVGKSALSQLAINAAEWKTADWAKAKGLYQEVFPTIEQVDAYISHLSEQLATFNPEAIRQIKQMLWEGSENWDELLAERAAISGRLVLSEYAKNAIDKFKRSSKDKS